MLKITIISVGNLKEKYYAEAVSEYEKRISAYAKISNINLKEELLGETREGDIAGALEREGERILASIPQRSYKVALCVEGKSISSEQLSELVENAKNTSGEICFIIGSSHGLADKVKVACDYKLSVSALTFPHRLMRVILTEAIYRALSIANGGKYHK